MKTEANLPHHQVQKIDPKWAPSILLAQPGFFFLEDVAEKLSIKTALLKAHVDTIRRSNKSPATVIGIQIIDSRWIVTMEIFSQYYLQNLANRIRRIDPDWDANSLLRQKGIFLLRDVCTLIPFTTGQIRYQVSKSSDSRKELGVWKQEDVGTYLVDMSIFGNWIISLWDREA